MLVVIDSKKKSNLWCWLCECVFFYDSLLIIFDMVLIDSYGVYCVISNLSVEDKSLKLVFL